MIASIENGQRWKFKSLSLIIEVIDSSNGECLVRQAGSSYYKVGAQVYYSIALGQAIRGQSTDLIYLEGQDAPQK